MPATIHVTATDFEPIGKPIRSSQRLNLGGAHYPVVVVHIRFSTAQHREIAYFGRFPHVSDCQYRVGH